MIVACRTGVAPLEWLEDIPALLTAADVLAESDRKNRSR